MLGSIASIITYCNHWTSKNFTNTQLVTSSVTISKDFRLQFGVVRFSSLLSKLAMIGSTNGSMHP